MILLTTRGRRTGQAHTVPVFTHRVDNDWIVCNVRPAGERRSPWVLNLHSTPQCSVDQGRGPYPCIATALDAGETAALWPRFVGMWPAYADHFAATGERTMFRLSPVDGSPDPAVSHTGGI